MSRSDVLVDADWVQAHSGDQGVVLVEDAGEEVDESERCAVAEAEL